jgi:hypothetical protein
LKKEIQGMAAETHIEVYEWEEGEPRPGAQSKLSRHLVDILEIPTTVSCRNAEMY